MGTETDLTQRLTTTLRAKADRVTVADKPFDPQRPASGDIDVELDVDVERGVRLRQRAVLATAAAVLLVGLLVAAGALFRSEDPTVMADAGPRQAVPVDGPSIASVELPSATLELHQEGDAQILCLHPKESGDLRCGDGLTASLVVDGTWYVAVAQAETIAAAPLIAGGWGDPPFTGDPGMISLEDQALPAETSNDAGWAFVLAAPPTDVEFVWLQQGFAHTRVDRPG